MSATEELRRLLDERGVEWRDASDENVLHTTWNDMKCWFNEFPDGWTAWGMSMSGTPEQAIAATLGQAERTCKLDYERHCSNCGVHVHKSAVLVRKDLDGGAWTVVSKPANYCPNCGARVEVSDE